MVWHFRGIQRVECVLIDSFTIILFVLLLWLLATKSTKSTKSTKYIGELKNKAKQENQIKQEISAEASAWVRLILTTGPKIQNI